MKQWISAIGQKAAQNNDPCERRNKQSEPCALQLIT